MSSQPFEIIYGPVEVWLAPYGTAFPALNTAPSGNWQIMGMNNMEEAGVTGTHTQTLNQWRGMGGTGPRKVIRSSEELTIMFQLVDLTLERYQYILGNTISSTPAGAGTIGSKVINLYMGTTVQVYAFLARAITGPYGDSSAANYPMQYEVPMCYQSDNPKPVYAKTKPVSLQMTFSALEDPASSTVGARFGYLRAMTASSTTAPTGVSSLSASNVTSTEIDLEWLVGAGATSQALYYKSFTGSAPNAATIVSGGTLVSIGASDQAKNVSALSPATEYAFVIVSTNGAGSTNGSVFTATTSAS
jgi:hypothetical protein